MKQEIRISDLITESRPVIGKMLEKAAADFRSELAIQLSETAKKVVASTMAQVTATVLNVPNLEAIVPDLVFRIEVPDVIVTAVQRPGATELKRGDLDKQ